MSVPVGNGVAHPTLLGNFSPNDFGAVVIPYVRLWVPLKCRPHLVAKEGSQAKFDDDHRLPFHGISRRRRISACSV